MQKLSANGRTIILALSVLMGTVGVAGAETLYQWEEADGSLTFSPTPPPEGSGIEYRLMNTGGESAADISLPETTLSASQIARSQPAPQPMLPETNNSASPTVNYAPGTQIAQRNVLPQGISRAETAEANLPVAANDQKQKNASALSEQPDVMASTRKNAQCTDFGKRIVALENRVTQSKTAAQMDEAILQISRYQNSYNVHCG